MRWRLFRHGLWLVVFLGLACGTERTAQLSQAHGDEAPQGGAADDTSAGDSDPNQVRDDSNGEALPDDEGRDAGASEPHLPSTGDGPFEPIRVPVVDPSVSAEDQWSECGRIEPTKEAADAAYAADGTSVLVLEVDGTVRLFPSGSNHGKILLPYQTEEPFSSRTFGDEGFQRLQLTPDGLLFLSVGPGEDGSLAQVYAAEDGAPITAATRLLTRVGSLPQTYEYCAGNIHFSANGDYLVMGKEPVACVWDVKLGRMHAEIRIEEAEMEEEPVPVGVEAVPVDPESLTVSLVDETLLVWYEDQLLSYALSGERMGATGFPDSVEVYYHSAVFSPDGRYQMARIVEDLDAPQAIDVLADTRNGEQVWRRPVPMTDDYYPAAVFSSNGQFVSVGRSVLRIEDGSLVSEYGPAYRSRTRAVHPDGARVLFVGHRVTDLDVALPSVSAVYGSTADSIRDLAFSRDGRHLATLDRSMLVWELSERFEDSLPKYTGDAGGPAVSVSLSADGQFGIASWDNVGFSSSAGGLRFLDLPVGSVNGCYGGRWTFSPGGRWAIGTQYTSTPLVVDPQTLEILGTLDAANCNGGVAFSPDGRRVVTASLEMFETGTWNKLWEHPSDVGDSRGIDTPHGNVLFSPDGSELVVTWCETFSGPCQSTRHSAQDGTPLAPLEIAGRALDYSPEGHWVVSAGELLHLPSGRRLVLGGDVTAARFAPNGDLVAGFPDGALVHYCRERAFSVGN